MSPDWNAMFAQDLPVLEIFIRGSIMYLVLFCILRFILKRQAGSIGLSDLLVIVLIADASQNAMASEYKSLPDGLLLVGTLVFWNYVLEWLGYHVPFIERILHAAPVPLVKNGRMLRKHMREEFITEDDLMSKIREEGIADIKQVKQACLEGDGRISVVKVGG